MMILDLKDPILGGVEILAGLSFVSVLLRLALSFILSGIIGIERAQKRHSAGLRTFMLVNLFATVGGIIDLFLMETKGVTIPFISVAIIVGLAIISANTLLYSSKSQIKGLTTSFALFSSSFIGLSLGFGLYTLSLIGFVLLLVIINTLPAFERLLKNRSNHFEVQIELKNKLDLPKFLDVSRELGIVIDDLEANPAYLNSGIAAYTVSLTVKSEKLKKYKTHEEIIEALSSLDYINEIHEI